MSITPRLSRFFAGVVAAIAWFALYIQFTDSLVLEGAAPAALWAMVRFFTVLTNLLVALVFTVVAFGRSEPPIPSWLGGVTVSIVVVGIVYALLLTGLRELTARGAVADNLLHRVTPILATVYWLIAAPRGLLTNRDPLLWVIFPIGYCAYAMARGLTDGNYAYPFLDFPAKGWPYVAIHLVVIAAVFLGFGYALVWLDNRLARR